MALLAGCRSDDLTAPSGRPLAPDDARPVLTGGAGVDIFPTVAPGEIQPTGVAIGLSDAGQITGSAFGLVTPDDYKPFRWTAATGAVRLVGCCDTEWGNDINEAGVVVGTAQTDAATGSRGFVASGTTMTRLPILPGAAAELSAGAVAINDVGQIVGSSMTGSSATHAVLWSSEGAIQDLGTLGGTNSAAIDINDAGLVIGSSQIAGDAVTHFFLWSALGGMADLNTLIGVPLESVVEINDENQITGTYKTAGGATHAFLYTPGSELDDLGTLGGSTSVPTGLNVFGQVVGSSTLADGSTHAFLWTATDGMEDITALTGITEVRRLNLNLQTLSGTAPPSAFSLDAGPFRPRLVQLQVTQSNTAPKALFTSSCNGLTCTFDASSSLDDKGVVAYSWELDNDPNGFATGAVVTTTYPNAGPRTVTLTVQDAGGATNSVTRTISVTTSPIAAFSFSCSGLTCSFDSGSSTDDGPIGRRIWYFGDESSDFDVVATTHTYAQAGTYAVTLEIWDTDSPVNKGVVTKQVTVTVTPPVNAPPVARFTASCSGLTCTFDAGASSDDVGIVAYSWSFDKHADARSGSARVVNRYSRPGRHFVTLIVTDGNGRSGSITQAVQVRPR
jgi:probable HAF family extracellular repeat protein